MALLRGKLSEIPGDAVVLSREEALKYQFKILHSWKHERDVFAFKYGGVILASFSACVGMFLNGYYRRKLKLRSHGKLSSYLPIVVLPGVMSFLLHTEFVLPDLVLQDNCPVCVQMRASALQSTLGVALPAVLAPLSSLALATQYGTYQVPYVTKEPLKVLKLWKTVTMPIGNLLFAVFVGQALLGSIVSFLESRSVTTVNEKLAKLEFDLETSDLHM